jgi:riboflavin kinase/FMN adenylyltransferase
MKIIDAAAAFDPGPSGVALAIGVFDGVHLGHQSVIQHARAAAEKTGAMPAVLTFDRHPNAIVFPQNVPPLIYPLAKKMRVIESLGVAATCVIRFDKAFSEISGEDFIRGLVRDAGGLKAICVGKTFQFGRKRSGNVPLLQTLGRELGFAVDPVEDVTLNGDVVSSTRIREAVRGGQFESAGLMLGRPYTLCGAVVAGAGLAQKLGYPTANLNVAGVLVPPSGVYAAVANVGPARYRAAVNIGHRPTVYAAEGGLAVEAHLLDFSGDLYHQEIELTFVRKLREEKKFPHLAALQEQIGRDIAAVRAEQPLGQP